MATAKKNEVTENEKSVENVESSNKNVEKNEAAVIIDKVVDSVSNSENTEKAKKKDETLKNEEEIAVRSVTYGGLTWVSPKTNAHYRWNDIGDIEYISFGELITMHNTARDFLFNPLVTIKDERVIDYFRLNSLYEKISCVNDLENLFNEGDLNKIGTALRELVNTNMRDIAISKIRTLRQDGSLTNIDVIRLIEKIMCFDID